MSWDTKRTESRLSGEVKVKDFEQKSFIGLQLIVLLRPVGFSFKVNRSCYWLIYFLEKKCPL